MPREWPQPRTLREARAFRLLLSPIPSRKPQPFLSVHQERKVSPFLQHPSPILLMSGVLEEGMNREARTSSWRNNSQIERLGRRKVKKILVGCEFAQMNETIQSLMRVSGNLEVIWGGFRTEKKFKKLIVHMTVQYRKFLESVRNEPLWIKFPWKALNVLSKLFLCVGNMCV